MRNTIGGQQATNNNTNITCHRRDDKSTGDTSRPLQQSSLARLGRSTGEPPQLGRTQAEPPPPEDKGSSIEAAPNPAARPPTPTSVGQQATTHNRSPQTGEAQHPVNPTRGQCHTAIQAGAPPTQAAHRAPHSAPLEQDWPDFMARVGYPHITPQSHKGTDLYNITDDYDCIIQQRSQSAPQGITRSPHVFRSWPYPAQVLHTDQAQAYERAISAELNNDPSMRPVITTSLKLDRWHAHATGHTDDGWILDAIKHGFPIQYSGPPRFEPPLLYNHSSATAHQKTIRDYIRKETAEGALHGPYDQPPFTPWMAFSPLMTREKPDSKERRVIVDLSYPDGGINAHIPPHIFNGRPAVHNLPSVETAVKEINKLCPGEITMAVIDLSRAYRQFPVPPTDWPLLGVQFEGKYFYDGRLPFGSRLSAFAMQSAAQFVVRALGAANIVAHMYLDDIIIIAGAKDVARRNYQNALSLLADLGLQVAPHKLQPPAHAVTWLGVHIDMHNNQLSIPAAKLEEIHKCLATAAKQTKISVRHLQSILGYINHLAKVVRAARVFISRLLAALRSASGDVILITPPVKADLGWFLRYLRCHNAREVIPHNRVVLRIWADSSLRGAGATDSKACYAHTYSKQTASRHHITQLEAINVLAAVRTFVNHTHKAGIVHIYGDNMASISAYSSGRARDTVLAACSRAMWFHAAETQTKLEFHHLPGEAMVLPDALSRASFDPAMQQKAKQIMATRKLSEVTVTREKFGYAAFL